MKRPKAIYIENMGIPKVEYLLLYYNPYSFSSQKVLMALHEKNLPFRSCIIDLAKAEQYDNWFLQISPNGELPVLQDGNRIIPYARNIINYLDEWYISDSNAQLVPNKIEDLMKFTHFRNIIDDIPETILTVGSFIHKKYIENPKPPFTHSIIQQIINGEQNASKTLYQKAKSCPKFSGSLLNKANILQSQHDQIVNGKEFNQVLSNCYSIFDQVETQLLHSLKRKKCWLVNETFNAADISLAVLLERMDRIGISKLFWGDGKRPNIGKYYERVRKRKSFKQSMPTFLMNFKMMYGKIAYLTYITCFTCALGLIISIQRKANFLNICTFINKS